ncbi:MAG: hypothetical protein LBC12_00300 [Nitrososphaerota archaeon]|jgi:predicted transcriptional regulator|nr:hypothetical protein [Nitrososphaerota archaeon]
MPSIDELNESQAFLRVLLTLYTVKRPLNQQELLKEIQTAHKIGQFSIKTATTKGINLGLIEKESRKIGNNPMPSLMHSLTEKGTKIAELLSEINKILQEKP